MTEREALEMALEALEVASSCIDGYYIPKGKTHLPEVEQAITAIKEALAQPEQEPVAFYVYKPTLPLGHLGNVSDGDLSWVYDQDPSSGYSARMLVYTTPPQRTWVGLTADELNMIGDRMRTWNSWTITDVYFAIEAKLKEKNT